MAENKKHKEFWLSTLAINNKTSIYVLTVIIALMGLVSYMNLPKEQFPEIVFPQMYVLTINDGTSPQNMENLVTKHIEKQMKSVEGVKKVTSTSIQDVSSIVVEFNSDEDPDKAKQRVKDAIDQIRNDLPQELTQEPRVIEIDISQVPIMNINLSGNYDLEKLKRYGELLQDDIEGMSEIRRVDLIGALEREIQINVDKYKMEAANITMYDVMSAVGSENVTLSGGLISMDGMKRAINIKGEFDDVKQLENLIIRSSSGAKLYLKDFAEIKDTHEERETYARLNHHNVVTLNVIKRGGENLIEASDKIQAKIADFKANRFPENLHVTVTADQSTRTRITLHDLINTIIIGFILVTIILMFFMGTTNAIFVALSVPLSMSIAFIFMSFSEVLIGKEITLNFLVLFAFLLALGIVVDDAIVVIENTHRIFQNGKVPIKEAAKRAAGEVFMPVLSGTLTTLAPFFPLLFWPGTIGNFMWFLPMTLIISLFASLLVAYIMNPVFAVDFMKPHTDDHSNPKVTKGFKITTLIFLALTVVFYLSALGGSTSGFGFGNLTLTLYILFTLNKFVFVKWIERFQNKTWPKVQRGYEKVISWSLTGWHPTLMLLSTVGMLIISIVILGIRKPQVEFFPQAAPNFIFTYISLPIGTDQKYTDSLTKVVENRVFKVIGENNPMVESVISNVGLGASEDQFDMNMTPHKGKVTVAFVEFAKRNGQSTTDYLDKIRAEVKGIPGAKVTVDRERGGPPTGKPINIELIGDDYNELGKVSENLIKFINGNAIPGIEELKSDLQKNKPEVVVEIDRQKARSEGISTQQIAQELRSALFGFEVSQFRDVEDDYPIKLRYLYEQRNDIETLMNLKITYRDMNMGGRIRQVPLSSVAKVSYSNTFGGIKRKNQRRIITVSSNVLTGYTPNDIVPQIQQLLPNFPKPENVVIQMTGEQEDQKETGAFLGFAMLVSIMLIFLILVAQFNSVSKPVIILIEILFCIIGVLLGFGIFKMTFSVVMTGIGIVALAGIVVRNGILLVEFTDELISHGYPVRDAIIQAGKIRMTPVLLTATATILGLIPLAVGLNIDFVTMFTELNPHLYFGGDSVAFWGPLSWTIIFGLSFATFLTLILVPCLYWLVARLKMKVGRDIIHKTEDEPKVVHELEEAPV